MTFSQLVEKKSTNKSAIRRRFSKWNVQIQLEIGESDLRNLFRDANSPILDPVFFRW